tara:strand:+ start:1034 stop:1768 length:735 start_codon:yes stop_codon:yes gene_type:complete
MAPPDRKILLGAAGAIVAVYLGGQAWGEIAYRYFRHQCDTRAGEFIYRTVENVAGIVQLRARDPRDYFDRVRKGDIPEDPFGHTNTEAQNPWWPLIGGRDSGNAYDFFETTVAPDKALQAYRSFRFENEPEFTGAKYWIYRRAYASADDANHNNITAAQTPTIRSRYGFTWRQLRGFWDRVFGVWGGELIAIDLATSEELAVRRGFILWATLSDRAAICPRDKGDKRFAIFMKKVLKPRSVAKP